MRDPVAGLLARRAPTTDPQPERLRTLLELLDRPDHAVPTVWVRGTHGKSSVVAMMTALLTALDVTTGASATPHLQDPRERVRAAGTMIAADTFREQLDYLDPFLREVDSRFAAALGFDEVVFALAATWFADVPVDVAVHEGVAPSTARVELTVESGAGTGAVVVDGTTHAAGDAFAVAGRDVAVGGQRLRLRGLSGTVTDVYLPLHGRHQAENAALALAAVEGFLGGATPLDADLVHQAFARLRLPGRLEVVRRADDASVLLDGAADAVGAAALAATLRDEFAVRHRVGVLGLVGHDPGAILQRLAPVLDHAVVAPAAVPGAAQPADVIAAARALGVPAERADSVGEALELASGVATIDDAIVVAGSLQTAGEARHALGLEPVDSLVAPA